MLHLLESRKTPLFPQMFHMGPICWSILHYDNPANCHLSIPYAKQSKISPELLIHLCCIMVHIWDWLFVAFEASLWADGTWNHVRSHEFMMCFISPAPPCCWAQTAADVMECTFVNIYPGEEPICEGGAQSMATLTEWQIMACVSVCCFQSGRLGLKSCCR